MVNAMNEELFKKWLTEEKKKEPVKNKNFYVLVGPPAVGKTSWIADFIESQSETFVVLSRDQIIEDQIFPKYKFSNNELYTIAPPKDAEVGKKIDGMENFGKVIMDKKGRKAFEHILRANAEVEETLKKEIKGALRIEPENIIVDAINATDRERAISLDIVKNKPNYKKIAIYFEFKPYQDQIKDRAAKRAMSLRKELGKEFDRTIPDKVYEAIFSRITIPHITEGFDEVYAYDSFKKVKKDTMDITTESLVLAFRKHLESEQKEEEILSEARLNKVWRQRAKARAKRHDREYPNKIDKNWALKQQAKWNKQHPELEEEYLKEIENAKNLTNSTKLYLEKLRSIRKAKLEAKFEKPTGKKRKTLPSPYAGEGPETEKFPYKKARTGGVAKVYQNRIKRISGAGAAPGETIGPGLGAGGIAEAVTQTAPIAMKTYGDLQKVLTGALTNKNWKFVTKAGKIVGVDSLLDLATSTGATAMGAAGPVGIAAGASLKLAYQLIKSVSKSNKKTDTFLDQLKIDPEYLKIVSDDVENSFFNFIKDKIFKMPPNEQLPFNFSMNKELKQWLRTNYSGRTVTGAF